ncbi:DUF3993 domain-containing protein [Bacillus solimangrovi]|uniref:Copper amine oxidase-like N-terminal domain-containing protein n=1 Tax=Bacillus solimangrovi TaxID=1305675 RepID=A0A1E5LK54_9BACI|nr:DUF3993 domain-containing protein [Bacillus solimangrovi]OEH94455.1 hypothetical protein BFG57_08320 [Bacillus solimangrovi]
MYKKWIITGLMSIITIVTFWGQPNQSFANSFDREEVFQFLEEAYAAQLSLNEKYRSLDEVHKHLNPYFTKDYTNIFVTERLFHDDEGYYLPGSDSFYAFVPHFKFNERTKIDMIDEHTLIVSEWFEANNEGPWSWDAHEEDVILKKQDGTFKIYDINGILAYHNEQISLKINGNRIILAQNPIIQNERTLIPLRAVSEHLNGEVLWDKHDQKIMIQKGDKLIKLWIGKKQAFVNEEAITLDTPAIVVNNRTMVPTRFVSEALDAVVEWEDYSNTINILSEDVITKHQAEDLVRAYVQIPEISETIVAFDHMEGDEYVIHVYDVVELEGGGSHTATIGWYYVHAKTNMIRSMF